MSTSLGTGGFRYLFDANKDAQLENASDTFQLSSDAFEEACTFLREDTLGQEAFVATPFGKRRVVYADFTASGRALRSIEDYLVNYILPLYGNTHTVSNATASQTTYYRIEARQIVKHYINATHEDALIFCGAGSTHLVLSGGVGVMALVWLRLLYRVQSINSCKSCIVPTGNVPKVAVCLKQPGARVQTKSPLQEGESSRDVIRAAIFDEYQSLYRAHENSERHKNAVAALQQHRRTTTTENVAQQERCCSRVVFFCDPTAHHSALLPFRELARAHNNSSTSSQTFEIVELRIDSKTCSVDISHLEQQLKSTQLLSEKEGVQIQSIVILSAGSNVTGLLVDVAQINTLIHSFNGIACWDFAAVSCHGKIDINPPQSVHASTDVAFFSPHKLLGGPGASGFLVIKKRLLQNAVPSVPGGGVVFYVSKESHAYIHNTEEREEGGTPNILSDIRCGLVYRLHTLLPIACIHRKETEFAEYLRQSWASHPRIVLLGPQYTNKTELLEQSKSFPATGYTLKSISIVSFLIRYGNTTPANELGLFLHYAFVVSLLNDLFGVQARGGCACAGPLGQYLLGMTPAQVASLEDCLECTGHEVIRPGFVRISLHFTMSWEDISFIDAAVRWVADHGWKLLPAYTFVPETGEWEHRALKSSVPTRRRWLSELTFFSKTKDNTQSQQLVFGCPTSVATLEGAREDPIPPTARKIPGRLPGAVSVFPLAWDAGSVISATSLKAALGSLKPSSRREPMTNDVNTSPSISNASSELQQKLARRRQMLDTHYATVPSGPTKTSDVKVNNSCTVVTQEQCVTEVEAKTVALPPYKQPDMAEETHLVLADQLINHNTALINSLYTGSQRTLLLTAAQSIPPVSSKYSVLLWFALPIDAAVSLLESSHAGAVPQLSLNVTNRPSSAFFKPRKFSYSEDNDASTISSTPKESDSPSSTGSDRSTDHANDAKSDNACPLAALDSEPFTVTANNVRDDGRDETLSVVSNPQQLSTSVTTLHRDYLDIPRSLRRLVGSAIREYSMIKKGDRLLVGLSGGKDSLTLLHVLRDAQRRSPVRFELAAATVDPQTPEYNPRPLVDYLKRLGITYHLLSYPIIELAKSHMQRNSICAFCSRMKRGILYSCMRQHGYNVLVLGQHLDDICESFFMSALHNGTLNTMKAHYVVTQKDIRVCRPLVYVREKVLAKFAKDHHLPVITDNCPACFSQPKERHRVKLLLAQQEYEIPHVFQTLLQSLKPLIALSSVNASLYNSGVSQRSVSLSNALADDVHDPFVTQCIERCDVGDQNSLPRSPPDRRRSNVEDQDLSAENALSACAFQYQSEASSCAFFRNAQR